MNFLSPDDIFSGMRRKSLCNGALLTLSSQNGKSPESAHSTPSKSKKERRRGSFNEASAAANSRDNSGRRSSLVSRWFKHISDAAEQYKPRSKNANHEPVDDPAIATLPHSNTKESLELTPERPPPMSATATVTTTPLAPLMMPPPTVHTTHVNNNNYDGGIHMRNGRRESTPTSSLSQQQQSRDGGSPAYQNIPHQQQQQRQNLSQYELSPAVNRTMSTRSCGEANNNYGADNIAIVNGVTLRHTQSARQAGAGGGGSASGSGDGASGGCGVAGDGAGGTLHVSGGASKRDSASIVYSNNSNNTRTLMQSSPPLVEPTAIQISISPAHTAEPVLTPSERLRRLDAAIRDGLLEKQKIICDMFRLPVEHFHEIVDIAAMPEAPKDSADIALAAYAQVQSLTEVLNEYMHVTSEQEISAVSTAVCDQCHEKQQRHTQQQQQPQPQQQQQQQQQGGALSISTSSSSSSGVSALTQVDQQTPPPLPPPNKISSSSHQTAQQQTPAPTAAKLQTPIAALDEVNIHEDDDGYCEIDELRLPALPPHIVMTTKSGSPPPPPLPPPAGSLKSPPLPPPPSSASTATPTPTPASPQAQVSTSASKASASAPTPELIKRQSTISTDSIPEESADELTQAAMDDGGKTAADAATKDPNPKPNAKEDRSVDRDRDRDMEKTSETSAQNAGKETIEESDTNTESKEEKNSSTTTATEEQTDKETTDNIAEAKGSDETAADTAAPAAETIAAAATTAATAELSNSNCDEQAAVNVALSTLSKLSAAISTVDSTTQTMPLMMNNNAAGTNSTNSTNSINININGGLTSPLCGPNRVQHANSLEPSIPCHALNNIVSALNAQISLLLPKINERDTERERLRKENQHLRELLNAMHERQRVEDKLETPKDNNATNAAAAAAAGVEKSQKDADAIDEIDPENTLETTTTATTTT